MNSKPIIQAIRLNDATDLLIETNDVLIVSPLTFLSFYAKKPVRTNKNVNTYFDHHMDYN